jgi:murein DD-endopeptidase MepM/ murein hydrolase activator NlpD
MWRLLKKIFSEKNQEITLLVIDEEGAGALDTFKFAPSDVKKLIAFIVLASFAVFVLIFFITPLHLIYQQRIDDNFREEVIAINERVLALQDSLIARELQLNDLKSFVRTVPDTTFEVEGYSPARMASGVSDMRQQYSAYAYEMLTRNEIMALSRNEREPDFPSFFPVQGTVTQGFSAGIGHYGVDIVAEENSEFRVIADGAIMHTDWTINYGYIVFVQHSEGIVSLYKHAARLFKEQGDYVLKGDVLGLVGNRGVLSTGSHLHLEVWKDGVPQNPLLYLNL